MVVVCPLVALVLISEISVIIRVVVPSVDPNYRIVICIQVLAIINFPHHIILSDMRDLIRVYIIDEVVIIQVCLIVIEISVFELGILGKGILRLTI
jgi:hypothetical protein